MASHRKTVPAPPHAEPVTAMGLLLAVVLCAWALSLLPGRWSLLGFAPVVVLALVTVKPLLIKRSPE